MASVRVPRSQASVDSKVLKTPEWKEELRSLGVDPDVCSATDNDIYAALKDLWIRLKREPRAVDLAKAVGMNISTCRLRMSRMAQEGRLLRVQEDGRAFYVPKKGRENG